MASKIYIFDLGGVISIPEDIHKTYLELNTKVDFEEFKKIWWDDQDVIDAHLGLKKMIKNMFHMKNIK